MNILYSEQAKKQLFTIKKFIAKDSTINATSYLLRIKTKIEILKEYPYLGKINPIADISNIRDFIIYGYKVIYKVTSDSIIVLAIYKYIDFDESMIKEGEDE
ncbi:MAG: type II toxin-antitoxin system RelE/ParE family toxin [Sulfuricurvum sp.]|nr:type II toxin-antitoxin system RelE/ParE family toxin [Sulfuricurvum sp.]